MKKVSLKKELVKFLFCFLIFYFFIFVTLSITGWWVRPNIPVPSLPDSFSLSRKQRCGFIQPNAISISKINIEAPIVISKSTDEQEVLTELKNGVVFYPSSVSPGNPGQTIFLGHSAPLGWPKIEYNWVFSELNKLEPGDKVIVFFDRCRYQYTVFEQVFLEKGEALPDQDQLIREGQNQLVLISCWPPGRDVKRIAVLATLDKD